ncbi:hypothetical protein RRG08_066155 [Elysia crispata]|uniref:Uncharacterized protein n=1 Tax=Elysia crispata TaxID=231223 RepID=A0AAE0ZQX7_9GAST|nr:hypothetical protein RRG08_066155 [Elysia crispata]
MPLESLRKQQEQLFKRNCQQGLLKHKGEEADEQLPHKEPKKDLCSLCLMYWSGDEKSKDKLNNRFHSHIIKKTKVRELKEASKQRAK